MVVYKERARDYALGLIGEVNAILESIGEKPFYRQQRLNDWHERRKHNFENFVPFSLTVQLFTFRLIKRSIQCNVGMISPSTAKQCPRLERMLSNDYPRPEHPIVNSLHGRALLAVIYDFRIEPRKPVSSALWEWLRKFMRAFWILQTFARFKSYMEKTTDINEFLTAIQGRVDM